MKEETCAVFVAFPFLWTSECHMISLVAPPRQGVGVFESPSGLISLYICIAAINLNLQN